MDERTRVLAAGRDPVRNEGAVAPPLHRHSTVVLERYADLYRDDIRTYGLEGGAVHEALRTALIEVEGGAGCELVPSGLSACALALMAFVSAGDHVLVPDSVYGPTRRLLRNTLARFGVSADWYDPRIDGPGLEALLRPTTRMVWFESPGSLTFEVQDVPALAAVCAARGIMTAIDNTWAGGVYFKPFDHGVDLSIQALTKYQAGHADVLAGAVLSRTPAQAKRVRATFKELGLGLSPDDAALILRGMRTMHLRMAAQDASARAIAGWLETRPEVAAVLHPALPSSPDHALWRRDFTGAAGLFGVVLHPVEEARIAAKLEGYRLFSMGFSWGGYESLVIPCDQQLGQRTIPWRAVGPLLRYSIGLETPADLIADLEAGFARLTGS